MTRLYDTIRRALESTWLPWAIVALGALLRLRTFAANGSLDVAEAALALNLRDRSFAQLMLPLDYEQGAPVGFLWIEKAVLLALGPHDWALRLFPVLTGVAALVLFLVLARRLLPAAAVPVAILILAVSPPAIFYAAQSKQYSSDVFITLALILLVGPREGEPLSRGRAALLAVAGAAAIWLSHPAALVLGGIGLVLGIPALRRRSASEVATLAGVAAVWLGSFGALYELSLRFLEGSAYLRSYWSGDFMPLPPRSIQDLEWFLYRPFEVYRGGVGLPFDGLAGALALIGVCVLLSERRVLAFLLLSPIATALLASAVHAYPFGRRLILFLVPAFVACTAAGIEALRSRTWDAMPWASLLLMGALLFDPVLPMTLRLVKPRPPEEMRPVMEELARSRRDGDATYVYHDAQWPYLWYAREYGVEGAPVVIGQWSENDWERDVADLEQLRGRPRVWLVFSHVWDARADKTEEDFFLFQLDRMGSRLASHRFEGSSLHLYDLSPGAASAPAAR